MLLFVPGLGLTRGGAAWMMKSIYMPRTWYDYYMILGAIAIAGGVSFLLMGPLTRWTIRFIEKVNYRTASILALVIILALVFGMTGWGGKAVMAVDRHRADPGAVRFTAAELPGHPAAADRLQHVGRRAEDRAMAEPDLRSNGGRR